MSERVYKVLWVSRHQMTEVQKKDLERVMGGPVELLLWQNTVSDAEELMPDMEKADAAAVVLPTELLAQFVKLAGDKPVIQAVSKREFTGNYIYLEDGRVEPEVAFVHKGWQQILKIELETRML